MSRLIFSKLAIAGLVFVCSMTGLRANAKDAVQQSPKAAMAGKEFLSRLRMELTKNLCSEGGLVDCFSVPTDSCRRYVSDQFSGCTHGIKIGKQVSLVGEDSLIANAVTECISKKFGRKFMNKLKESNECQIRKNL